MAADEVYRQGRTALHLRRLLCVSTKLDSACKGMCPPPCVARKPSCVSLHFPSFGFAAGCFDQTILRSLERREDLLYQFLPPLSHLSNRFLWMHMSRKHFFLFLKRWQLPVDPAHIGVRMMTRELYIELSSLTTCAVELSIRLSFNVRPSFSSS